MKTAGFLAGSGPPDVKLSLNGRRLGLGTDQRSMGRQVDFPAAENQDLLIQGQGTRAQNLRFFLTISAHFRLKIKLTGLPNRKATRT